MTASLRPLPRLEELVEDPLRARFIAPEDAARILIQLAPVQRALELAVHAREPADARAAAAAAGAVELPPRDARWISPDDAAAITNVSRRQIYSWSRRADWRQFTARPSRKVLRIEEAGFQLWLSRASRPHRAGSPQRNPA